MPTSTSQSAQTSPPATSPVAGHVLVTPIVHEIPRGPGEPASFTSIW